MCREFGFISAERLMSFRERMFTTFLLHMLNALKLINKSFANFNTLANEVQAVYQNELGSNNYGHLADLATLQYLLGDYQKTIETILIDRKSKRTLRADLLLVKALIQLKKVEEARDILEEQIARGSTDASLDYLMLEVLPGDYNSNLRELYLSKAKRVNPNFNSDLLFKVP